MKLPLRARSRSLAARSLAGCAVGPDYERPSAPVPAAYKEATARRRRDWLPAAPADALDARRLVAPVRRRRARTRSRREVEVVEPERRRRGRRLSRRRRRWSREPRAALLPDARRSNASARAHGGGRDHGTAAPTPSRSRSAPTGRPTSGAARPRRRERARQRAGERRRPRLGARCRPRASSRSTTSRCARPTPRSPCSRETIEGYERALQITQNRYAAGIAPKTDVLQAADPARHDAGRPRRGARQPRRASSTRSPCWSARRRATSALAAGRLDADRAGGAARRAVGAAAAPARHRLGRAPGGRRQRPDRHRALGVLSQPVARRHRSAAASRGSATCSAPRARSGRSASRWRRPCSTPARPRARVEGAEAGLDAAVARYRQTVLTRVPGGRGPARDRALARRAGRAAPAGLRRRRPDRAADPQPLSRRPGGYTDVVTAQASALSARRALVQVARQPAGERDRPDPGARRRLGAPRRSRSRARCAPTTRAEGRAPPAAASGKRGTP